MSRRLQAIARRLLNIPLRILAMSRRILAITRRLLNIPLRILAMSRRIQATAQHLTMDRQKTHYGTLFTSTLGRGETPITPAQRACTTLPSHEAIVLSSTKTTHRQTTKMHKVPTANKGLAKVGLYHRPHQQNFLLTYSLTSGFNTFLPHLRQAPNRYSQCSKTTNVTKLDEQNS